MPAPSWFDLLRRLTGTANKPGDMFCRFSPEVQSYARRTHVRCHLIVQLGWGVEEEAKTMD